MPELGCNLPLKSPKASAAALFAERIKYLIQCVGSVTELARRCGFSEGVVRGWRNGHSDPSRARCVILAKTLGVSLVWLMAGDGAVFADGDSKRRPQSAAQASPSHTVRATVGDRHAAAAVGLRIGPYPFADD